MACASAIAQLDIAHEIALYDRNEGKVKGEVLDLEHALPFSNCRSPPFVYGSSDIQVTADSDLVVVSTGVRQNPGRHL